MTAPTTMSGASVPASDRPLTAGDEPSMPTVELSGDAMVKIASGEVVTWAEACRRLSRPAASDEGVGDAIKRQAYDLLVAGAGGFLDLSSGRKSDIHGVLCAALASPPVSERPALTVWYGSMPESNGKANWTAELRRVNPTDKWSQGFCFARSEYPGRVLYEADRMRWIIGERAERPDILAYDADTHSDYVPPAPPLSERERELEGALREALPYLEVLHSTSNGTEARDIVWRVIQRARVLTAQPAGEGK